MWDHLRFQGDKVVARSGPGHFAAEYLDLNDPKIVEFRRFVLDLIEKVTSDRNRVESLMRNVDRDLAAKKISALQAKLDKGELQITLDRLISHFERLTGTLPA